jgi:hypothetical protein
MSSALFRLLSRHPTVVGWTRSRACSPSWRRSTAWCASCRARRTSTRRLSLGWRTGQCGVACVRACVRARHAHARTNTHKHKHTQTHTNTHKYTHTQAHTPTHKHTHKHTYGVASRSVTLGQQQQHTHSLTHHSLAQRLNDSLKLSLNDNYNLVRTRLLSGRAAHISSAVLPGSVVCLSVCRLYLYVQVPAQVQGPGVRREVPEEGTVVPAPQGAAPHHPAPRAGDGAHAEADCASAGRAERAAVAATTARSTRRRKRWWRRRSATVTGAALIQPPQLHS